MTRAVSDSFAHRALLGFSLTFVALGIAPVDRQSWFVENIMVLLVVAALWCKDSRPALSLSAWSATLLFLFIHQIGAHYTYPDVPYNAWLLNVFSLDLNGLMGWERNQYDRFVHLTYGLLLSVPIRELSQQMGVKPRYVAFIAWNLVMSTSAVYELMEWLGGAYLSDHGADVVGAQDDFWDAQKDMALAGLGAMLTLGCMKKPAQRPAASALKAGEHG
jgi:putative membrane protein